MAENISYVKEIDPKDPYEIGPQAREESEKFIQQIDELVAIAILTGVTFNEVKNLFLGDGTADEVGETPLPYGSIEETIESVH